MEVATGRYQRIGLFSAIMIVFLALAAAGVWFIYQEGWGLMYEITYVVFLLIGLAVLLDKLFVR